jgi:hypothetical protein
MNQQIEKMISGICLIGMTLGLSGCGGHKVLKVAQPMVTTQVLASADDGRLAGNLDWVIYRDGPGTWVRNADWDQYLMTFTNNSDEVLEIRNATVYDYLEVPVETQASRKMLIRGSKQAAKRYEYEGLKVKAGIGGGALVIAGTATGAAAVSLGAAAALGGSAVAATAVTGLLIAPVLIVGGIMNGVNSQKVAKEIDIRQVDLPVHLQPGETAHVSLFFPLSPSPQKIVVDYRSHGQDQSLNLDSSEVLNGLHLAIDESTAGDSD